MIAPRMYLSKRFASLPPRQKLLARLALYGGLALTIGLIALGIAMLARPLESGDDIIASGEELAQNPAVQLLQEYIRIDTSTSSGTELAGAEFLAQHLAAAGLEPHIERLADNKANLWAILEGESPEAVVLHSHIDVFDVVDQQSWEFPPFAGTIDQAWIYGRGAFDMKSVTVAQLLAITELAAEGHRPERSIIFLASGSEEVGSDLGSKWVLANHPELVERLAVVLTEGGVVEAISHDEIKFWGIEFAQKWFAYGSACSSDRARLELLQQDLHEISESNLDLRLTAEVEQFLTGYANSRTSEDIQKNLNAFAAARYHPDQFRQLPPYLKSLFRDETAFFEIESDPEGGYCMGIILHLLPGSEFAEVKQRLLPDWATAGVTLNIAPPVGAGHGSPVHHPAMDILVDAVREAHPQATVGPYFLAWSATDARFFRLAGIPTYGFSPFLIFATDTYRRDTINERIDIRGFVDGVELYREVVRRLAD